MVRRSRPVRLMLCAAFALMIAPGLARAQTPPADTPAPGGWRARPVRQGTVSLGGQLLYSMLLAGKSGEPTVDIAGGGTLKFANEFDNGLGAGFNLRYRTSPDAAIAITFEGQNYNVKVPSDS